MPWARKSSGDRELPSPESYAVSLLSYGDNTENGLRVKLRRKGYNADEIERALAFVKEKHYQSDARYAENAAYYYANKKLYGKRRIIFELKKKGITSEVIGGLDFSDIDFTENCREAANKLGGDGEKLAAALSRRGFSLSEIRSVLRSPDGE